MAELIWNINGKYFKDFGVYVSDSKGIMDEPNQKKTDTYDWAEYHGLATNLQSKPKYEAREFELSCWVKGADWLEMRNNFDGLMAEFRKAGKQRLTLDIFGEKTYVWDVNINGKIELKKTLQKGVQVGVFTIKLIEYNPIKKVLTTTKPNLQLAFNSPKWVEVNIDGTIESHKGVVNINKTLPNRVLSSYNFEGRNILAKGNLEIGAYLISNGNPLVSNKYIRTKNKIEIQPSTAYKWKVFKNIGLWSVVFLYFDDKGWYIGYEKAEEESVTISPPNAKYIHINIYDNPENTKVLDINYVNSNINFKLKKGLEANSFSYAPEDEKYIIIAGNIEEITNLTTNAEVLWERL